VRQELVRIADGRENNDMELNGIVQNGVIVLTGGESLPEGTVVRVSCDVEKGTSPLASIEKKRVQLPLVRTGEPGSMKLSNARIGEIFEEEDLASARR
jgi:hypothetical protein